jgi:hypothetical protein
MKAKKDPSKIPWRELTRAIPPSIKTLLFIEILIRWGNWFARDFAVLYVMGVLMRSSKEAGMLLALTSLVALISYIPMGKIIDASKSPRIFIGATFFLFAMFPINLIFFPKLFNMLGWPVMGSLIIVFALNGLKELGEPARKALIAGAFPQDVRAQSIGLYWGMRSFAFFPAPLVSSLLWREFGPEITFMVGGFIGLVGTIYFFMKYPKT